MPEQRQRRRGRPKNRHKPLILSIISNFPGVYVALQK
jgi:hypothetical protein